VKSLHQLTRCSPQPFRHRLPSPNYEPSGEVTLDRKVAPKVRFIVLYPHERTRATMRTDGLTKIRRAAHERIIQSQYISTTLPNQLRRTFSWELHEILLTSKFLFVFCDLSIIDSSYNRLLKKHVKKLFVNIKIYQCWLILAVIRKILTWRQNLIDLEIDNFTKINKKQKDTYTHAHVSF